LEHEIRGKTVEVSPDGLIESLGFNPIKRREVTIQRHPLPANQENRLLNLFGSNKRRLVVHEPSGRAYYTVAGLFMRGSI